MRYHCLQITILVAALTPYGCSSQPNIVSQSADLTGRYRSLDEYSDIVTVRRLDTRQIIGVCETQWDGQKQSLRVRFRETGSERPFECLLMASVTHKTPSGKILATADFDGRRQKAGQLAKVLRGLAVGTDYTFVIIPPVFFDESLNESLLSSDHWVLRQSRGKAMFLDRERAYELHVDSDSGLVSSFIGEGVELDYRVTKLRRRT